MNVFSGPMLGLANIVIGPAILAYKFYTSAAVTLGVTRTGLFFCWLAILSMIIAVVMLDEPA